MGGYLGPQPVPQAVIHKQRFPLASGQTSVATAGYIPGYVNAWLNGQRLDEYDDFTATNGSDVVLTVGGGADGLDVLIIEALVPFQVLNQYFTGTTKVDALNVLGGATIASELNLMGAKFGSTTFYGAYVIPKSGGTVGDFTIANSSGMPCVVMDSSGRVLSPYQPGFAAYSTGGETNYTGTSDLITAFNATTFNIGNCYNTTTSRFTAPVAGKYLFSASGWKNVGTADQASFGFFINGSQYNESRSHSVNEARFTKVVVTDVIYLNVNDYVELRTTNFNQRTMIAASLFTRYSGAFLG